MDLITLVHLADGIREASVLVCVVLGYLTLCDYLRSCRRKIEKDLEEAAKKASEEDTKKD